MQGARYKLVCLGKNSSDGEQPVPPTAASRRLSGIRGVIHSSKTGSSG